MASKAIVLRGHVGSNPTPGIRKLFCDACDLLGIEWRVMNAPDISVASGRAGAADQFVGAKR
jgi:hypothetical protein